jgi:integrase/recombinase XerD
MANRTSNSKLPKGIYRVGDVLWGRKRINRRLRRFTLETDCPKTAKARYEARVKLLIAEKHGEARYSVSDAYEAWGLQLDRLVTSAKTAKRYRGSMVQLRPYLVNRFLDQVDAKLLSAIVEGRRKQGVKDGTIKRDLSALSSVMRYAAGKGWAQGNPIPAWLSLDQVHEVESAIVLPREQDIALVKSRAPKMIAHAINVAIATGAREDELVKAQCGDIDHERKQFTLVGKRNKRRTIEIDAFGGYEALSAIPAHDDSTNLIWHDAGELYSTFAQQFFRLTKETAKWAKANGVDFRKFTFHSLRHLHAITFLKSGRPIHALKERLGHTSVATTEKYLRAGYLTDQEVRFAMYGKAA